MSLHREQRRDEEPDGGAVVKKNPAGGATGQWRALRRGARRRRWASPFVILFAALTLTLAVWWGMRQMVTGRAQSRFLTAVQSTQDRIQGRLESNLAAFAATKGLFASSEEVTPSEFDNFVDLLEVEDYASAVTAIGITRGIASNWAETLPELLIPTDQTPTDLETIATIIGHAARGTRAAALQQAARDHRQAMERARDSGAAISSGQIWLPSQGENQAPAPTRSILVYLPIYAGQPTTVPERRAMLRGFVYGPISVERLLGGVIGTAQVPRVWFQIDERTPDGESGFVYRSPSAHAGRHPSFSEYLDVAFAGMHWQLGIHSTPWFEHASGLVYTPFILVIGGMLSGLLFLVLRRKERTHETLRQYTEVLEEMTEERARLLNRAEEALGTAKQANRAKDEFLAMLGHELRNPLAPIVTGLELIRLRQGGSLGREYQVIERQVNHVVRLVDDLLDVSRITRGKLTLKKRPVELSTLVARAVEVATPAFEESDHHLAINVPSHGLLVNADETRLSQVIANLLSNAAKYTERGGHIEVNAALEGDEVVLTVADDGIGIAADVLPHIFDLFAQGRRGIDRSQGGLGIGLTLVRRFIEAHGGQVSVSSEGSGRGTTFEVRLPLSDEPSVLASVSSELSRGSLETDQVRRRVLVVDDNEDAAEMLADFLRRAGHIVETAHDGPQALSVAASLEPEVAVLDIGLPVMDGYELGARLRQQGAARLFAVTGYGQEHDRERSREAGFEMHMVKPINVSELLLAIAADADSNTDSLHLSSS